MGSNVFRNPMFKSIYDTDQNDIVDEAEVAVPSAHDLSGALHNSSTLANLNLKISDATLDDSGDSRPPTNHASNHTDGTDDLQNATNGQKGLATAAQITALEAVVTLSHTQGTDLGLDTGGTNPVTAAEAESAYTHSQLSQIAELENLTVLEVQQLENIGASTISATQWGYLGSMNQSVATGSDVSFNSISLGDDKKINFGDSEEGYIQWNSSDWLEIIGSLNGGAWLVSDTGWAAYIGVNSDGIGFIASDGDTIHFNADGSNADSIIQGDADTVLFTCDAGLDRVGVGIALNTHAFKFQVGGTIGTNDDIEITVASKGLILRDTQGTPHKWRVTVDNTGNLVTSDLGVA